MTEPAAQYASETAARLPQGKLSILSLSALGIVFGDIGTSPLYAFQVALTGIGHPVPTAADVLGIVSLILWALTMMVSLKYVVFVLRADNDGEGGILALLSLVGAEQVADGARLPALVLLGVAVENGLRDAGFRIEHDDDGLVRAESAGGVGGADGDQLCAECGKRGDVGGH